MSDWPAPSSAVPRRQNALQGCMASLPQVFQWSRVLGSNNKCIVIPADVQIPSVAMEKSTRIKGQTKQMKLQHQEGLESLAPVVSNKSAISSSCAWKASDSNIPREMVGMDLRQVLHAKQEPFVLQDVINEKRHPMRTASSRELKFEVPPTRRSAKMKEDCTTSKHQVHTAGNGHTAECQSQFCGAPKSPDTGSTAVVRRSRFPVESMVAMPSYQTASVDGSHSAAKSHSKVASLGRNPVKSPNNKRALLMEAAAKILEGSMNRRTSKRLSTSVRSLLEDLDKSKHVKKPLKPTEKFLATVASHSRSTKRDEVTLPVLVIPEERAAESTQHQNPQHVKCASKHNSKSSCRNQLEMSQVGEEDLLVMQKRVFPCDNGVDEAEALPALATPQNPSSEEQNEYAQSYDGLCSGMKGIEKETIDQNGGLTWNSSKALLHANTMLSEVILSEDHRPEHNCSSHVKESRAIVLSTSIDSHAKSFPIVLISICLPNLDYRMPSQIRSVLDDSSARHFIQGYHSATAPFPVDSTENGEASSPRITRHSLNEGADETEYTDILRDKFVESEMQSGVMQLRLCNYSWWASDQNNFPENQLSTDNCDSPVAATRPCFGQMWTKEITDEAASSHEYSDQFQQASPVSVLEPVYEEELELTDSFDSFEETRQKLLEKVRRYEMLAHMDVDTLKKVSEEHMPCAWEDHESWEADHNYSCSSSNSSSQASPAHQFSSCDMEMQVSRKCFMREPYFFSPDDQSYYGQEVKMRSPTSSLLDCSAEKLEPRLSSSRVLHSQRMVSRDEHIDEVAGMQGSRSIAASYMVNDLLHKDLAMSKWSSSAQEEVEEVELELESSFFEVLMWELLSDLLRTQSKPFCNAFDLMEHPVHNSELSTILPITT